MYTCWKYASGVLSSMEMFLAVFNHYELWLFWTFFNAMFNFVMRIASNGIAINVGLNSIIWLIESVRFLSHIINKCISNAQFACENQISTVH